MSLCRLMVMDFTDKIGRYDEEDGEERYSEMDLKFGAAYAQGLMKVIAAWGALKPRFVKRALHVVAMCTELGVPLVCLGQTKGGYPRHPLYVKKDQKRVTFRCP